MKHIETKLYILLGIITAFTSMLALGSVNDNPVQGVIFFIGLYLETLMIFCRLLPMSIALDRELDKCIKERDSKKVDLYR